MSTDVINKSDALQRTALDYVLLDASGSMASKWLECIVAIDAYMAGLRKAEVNSHTILHSFNGIALHKILRDAALSQWVPLSMHCDTFPCGLTPLLDAINLMAREIAKLAPPPSTIIIVTDGKEEGSQHTTLEQARAMLNWLRGAGHQIIFFGCDFNNSRQARELGINDSNCIGVQKTLLLEAAASLATKRINNARTGSDISFSDTEKTQFGGYLAAPEA